MRRALVLIWLWPVAALAAGPEFQHKDPIIQQEFENAYKDIRSVLPVTGNAKCIDSPTLCVDSVNNRVGVGNSTPSTLLHLSSGTLTVDGTAPGIAVGGSTFTVTNGVVSVGKQLRVGDGSAAAPVYSFTNDSDTGFYRTTANEIRVANGGTATWTFDGASGLNAVGSGGHIFNSSGTATTPAYTFSADSSSGLLLTDSHEMSLATNGSLKFHISGGGHVYPENDNAWQCGINGHRWLQIWSANGTIQTSSSKLKKQIREIVVDDSTTTLVPVTSADISTTTFNAADNPNDVQVPRGIVFKWRTSASTATANADVIGFLGDDLPQEAHALLPDGTRDPSNFYTSAVIGIQSAAIRALQKRVHMQQRRIKRLETIVSELETQLNVTVTDPDPGATQ